MFKAGDKMTEAQAVALNTMRLWFSAQKMNSGALKKAARALVQECLDDDVRDMRREGDGIPASQDHQRSH